MRKCALVAGCAALLAFPAVAYADTQDDQFINLVRAQGIDADSGMLINFAHEFCDKEGTPAIGGPAMSLMGTLGQPNAHSVAVDAGHVYCPDKLAILEAPNPYPYYPWLFFPY